MVVVGVDGDLEGDGPGRRIAVGRRGGRKTARPGGNCELAGASSTGGRQSMHRTTCTTWNWEGGVTSEDIKQVSLRVVS